MYEGFLIFDGIMSSNITESISPLSDTFTSLLRKYKKKNKTNYS